MKSKVMKRICGVLLASAMVLGMAGCGQGADESTAPGNGNAESKTEADERKDPVILEWYYRGNGPQKDTQLVEDKLNEYLKTYEGLEHVTVHMNCFAAADYANSVLLDQTSGKQIDILNTVGLDFATEVKNGTYLAIDSYLEQMPELKGALPQWLWDLGKVEGSTYMIPNYQRGANMMYMVIPSKYEKYIDIDKFREMLVDKTTPVEDFAAVMEEFIVAVREGEATQTKYLPPLAELYTVPHYGFAQYADKLNGSFVLYCDDTNVQNIYLTENFKKACAITADWYEKGYIPQDVLVADSNTLIKENMLNDISRAINSEQSYGDEAFASELISSYYGFDTKALPFHNNYFMQNSWGAGGNGVTASCGNPEEALKFIEALTTEKGKEIYNLIVYGIEGVHYEKVDENHIKTLEYDQSQGGIDTSYAAMKWIIGNTTNAYLNQGCSESDNEIANEINNNPDNIISPIMGFRIDTAPIATELEQIAAVEKEYKDTLMTGAMGSKWESTYNEFIEKLEIAGLDKVMIELQAQVDAFLK